MRVKFTGSHEPHVYDIEPVPGVEPDERFIVRLFYLYGQFKSYKRPFSLPEFCHHHEIKKADIDKLRQVSFSIGYQAGWTDGLKVDQYRNEIFEQMELFCRTAKPQKPPASLEAMFASKKHLNYLVKDLTAKSFCHLENGSLTWTGIKHHEARGKGLQLVALAHLCLPYYKKDYQPKELHEAWTTFFNYELSYPNFLETGKRPAPGSVYDKLFTNLINTLRLI